MFLCKQNKKRNKQIKKKLPKSKRQKFRYGYRKHILCLSFLNF